MENAMLLSAALTLLASAAHAQCPVFPLKVLSKIDNGNYQVSYDRGSLHAVFEEDDFAAISRASAESLAFSPNPDPTMEKVFVHALKRFKTYLNTQSEPKIIKQLDDGSYTQEDKAQVLSNMADQVDKPLAKTLSLAQEALDHARSAELKAVARAAIEVLMRIDSFAMAGIYPSPSGKLKTEEMFPSKLELGFGGCWGRQSVELLGAEIITLDEPGSPAPN